MLSGFFRKMLATKRRRSGGGYRNDDGATWVLASKQRNVETVSFGPNDVVCRNFKLTPEAGHDFICIFPDRRMEGDFDGYVPCSSLAVDYILRVGTAGAIWGLCMSPYDARKKGLTGLPRAAFVAKSVGKITFQCGVFAGVFSSTRCVVQRQRRKNDWVNSAIAGAVAGATLAARAGSWKQVVGLAGLFSAFSAAADYYKAI